MIKTKAIFVLTLLFVSAVSLAQTRIYKIERKLEVNKAYKPKKKYGIKGDGTGGRIEVRMYAKKYYTTGGRTDENSFLYGGFTTSNMEGYHAAHWNIEYFNSLCAVPVLGTFPCLTGFTDLTYRKKSTDYKDRLVQVTNKLSKIDVVGTGDFVFNPVHRFPVVIEVELHGSTTLDDIREIFLPGVKSLYAYDFYRNPCNMNPSLPGCEAWAAFKNVSTAENRKPVVIAHRGFHGDRATPENSMVAVQRAYDSLYRYVEVDIRMTNDNVPFLFHDGYLGYATNYPMLDNTNVSTHTEEKTWTQLQSLDLKYRSRYWDGDLETTAMVMRNNVPTEVPVRLGRVTEHTLTSFEELCAYIQGKDLFVYLDIKSAPTAHNFDVMRECINIGFKFNVLHQIAFKMVRTNFPDPNNPNSLVMTVVAAKEHLGTTYEKLGKSLNIHVVDYAPHTDPTFIKDWIDENNVIGFEFDIQNDPLFDASALKRGIAAFGGLSAWEYTKSLGYRTGIWSSTALDPRGRPGHDPSSWGTGGAMGRANTSQRYKDNRARLEILSLLAPQYITHDRPDEVKRYLEAVQRLNPHTIR